MFLFTLLIVIIQHLETFRSLKLFPNCDLLCIIPMMPDQEPVYFACAVIWRVKFKLKKVSRVVRCLGLNPSMLYTSAECEISLQMFGLIVSGQLVKTDFQLVGEKQFLINVTKADAINHIVIFLTGTIPFPDGFGGLVYFSFPDPNSPPCWHLLGFISNEKPSAIFKVQGLKNTKKYALNAEGTTLMFGQGDICLNAQIGIAIESLANIQQQCPATLQENVSVPAFVEFSQKMLQNFLNYASSFVVTQAQMVPNPMETFIPSSILTTWYSNFERRLLQNPYFWRD